MFLRAGMPGIVACLSLRSPAAAFGRADACPALLRLAECQPQI